MLELKEVLEKRIYQLKQIIQKEEKELQRVPEGTLQIYGPIKHPDFTILNVRKRKEYIWEHMGKWTMKVTEIML